MLNLKTFPIDVFICMPFICICLDIHIQYC